MSISLHNWPYSLAMQKWMTCEEAISTSKTYTVNYLVTNNSWGWSANGFVGEYLKQSSLLGTGSNLFADLTSSWIATSWFSTCQDVQEVISWPDFKTIRQMLQIYVWYQCKTILFETENAFVPLQLPFKQPELWEEMLRLVYKIPAAGYFNLCMTIDLIIWDFWWLGMKVEKYWYHLSYLNQIEDFLQASKCWEIQLLNRLSTLSRVYHHPVVNHFTKIEPFIYLLQRYCYQQGYCQNVPLLCLSSICLLYLRSRSKVTVIF